MIPPNPIIETLMELMLFEKSFDLHDGPAKLVTVQELTVSFDYLARFVHTNSVRLPGVREIQERLLHISKPSHFIEYASFSSSRATVVTTAGNSGSRSHNNDYRSSDVSGGENEEYEERAKAKRLLGFAWRVWFQPAERHFRVPRLMPGQNEDFVKRYNRRVALRLRDDFAILIYALRMNLWRRIGSGGASVTLENGLQAVKKFTVLYEPERDDALEQQTWRTTVNTAPTTARRSSSRHAPLTVTAARHGAGSAHPYLSTTDGKQGHHSRQRKPRHHRSHHQYQEEKAPSSQPPLSSKEDFSDDQQHWSEKSLHEPRHKHVDAVTVKEGESSRSTTPIDHPHRRHQQQPRHSTQEEVSRLAIGNRHDSE